MFHLRRSRRSRADCGGRLLLFPRTRAICTGIVKSCSSSLLKNLEIGASPVFLPWGLGRSGIL